MAETFSPKNTKQLDLPAISRRVANRLEELMVERETNPTEVARRAGLNYTAVRDIILGKSRAPTIVTLDKIARALNVSSVALLSGEAITPDSELQYLFSRLGAADRQTLLDLARSLVARG